MDSTCDVVVVGLGIMGAATVWQAANGSARVLGIDANGPEHDLGSSHGATRIFRRAYWEGEQYLPLLDRADMLWRALPTSSPTPLMWHTGGLFIGPRHTGVVAGSARTAAAGGIEHQVWGSTEIRRHMPAFHVRNDAQAVYEPGAYVIAADAVRRRMLAAAADAGAMIRHGDAVASVEPVGDVLRVNTRSGNRVDAPSVVVTAGPWITALVPELGACVRPKRVPIYWFAPKAGLADIFDPRRFPAFLYECEDGSLLYGVPPVSRDEPWVKIGFHNRQQREASPDGKHGLVSHAEVDEMSRYVGNVLPGLEPVPVCAKTCFYTMSRDESFVIGTSARHPRIHFASACSGHGFKFATAIGEALAHLALGSGPSTDIAAFSAARFAPLTV